MTEEIHRPESKLVRRILIALGCFVPLIALYYGCCDWRGAHAWNKYRRDYEAHVASLDFQNYIPRDIPESDNFAATPVASSWAAQTANPLFNTDQYAKASAMIYGPSKKTKAERKFADLVAWQEAFSAVSAHAKEPKGGFRTDKLDAASRRQAATAILDGLSDDKADFKELRAAGGRPESRYPVVYNLDNPWGTLLVHLMPVKEACRRLQLRASAELALDRTQDALDDIQLSFRLADSIKSEPFIISYLVRLACVQIAVQPIWEGLADHRWHEAELQQLQSKLEPCDFLFDLEAPLHSERALGVLTVDLVKKKGLSLLVEIGSSYSAGVSGPAKSILDAAGHLLPNGWYDQEKLHYCTGFDQLFQGAMDESAKRVFPSRVKAELPRRTVFDAVFNHHLIEQEMLSSIGRLPLRGAAAQTATDEAAVACALERYRLVNGHFPDTLPTLVPRFMNPLPNDVITGQPLHYRTTGDDHFVLYSVGWNETDEGGTSGKTLFDETNGDWVW